MGKKKNSNDPPPTPKLVKELAQGCVAYVEKAVGMELDFEPETLSILDHYGSLVKQGEGIDEPDTELVRLLASAMGAYFGEVIRRRYNCRWITDDEDPAGWRLEFMDCFLYFNPVGMAMEAVLCDHCQEWGSGFATLPGYMNDLADALDSIPGVQSGDFFRFTTRWDTLAFIVDWLVARCIELSMQKKPSPSTTKEAYRNFIIVS